MDKTSFLKYLALGEQKPAPATETAEDFHMLDLTPSAARGWFPPMKALPKPQYPIKPGRAGDLEEHDRRFHPEGYKEGDKCKYREELAKKDEADRLAAEGGSEAVKVEEFAKAGGFPGKPVAFSGSYGEWELGDGETVYELAKEQNGYAALATYDPKTAETTLHVYSPYVGSAEDFPVREGETPFEAWQAALSEAREIDKEHAEAEREYLDMVRRS